ncbi:Cytochrome c1 heme lyase [Orbilia oligospora]|uniref:Holocytochrome c-type synthase n=1 Tax=Orbilia oligospora TaxID=2813651 RepID=A0A7C8J5N1_ORBOL|nr:Cytochrome c1 heme lyase [Orbilia oligospora]KAF3091045.1 Cytochrome c1 heme lyase [Orbilia oligospora]KAF3097858.1 Cytochrome c1 heme lyase [Orbilia oligospora]KAF3123415.1 Cytochrome c1 heme lyase [Orbilia oligospora]KAF3131130.1 Cytochrome c1 heme lyase [Orbilia oligospora]
MAPDDKTHQAAAQGQLDSSAAAGCPVDHSTRAAWLKQQKQQQDGNQTSTQPPAATDNLSKAREVSSIPRVTISNGNAESPNSHAASSVSPSVGNWIYPSEKMFFDAMKRKDWDPKAEDMRMIVPIHNAVNERAWAEIRDWEKGKGSEKCGGPRLLSFSGDASKLSPKARILVLLGYQAPFDRHDWVIDRCGTNVEYIIDFYSGKRDPNRPEIPSFYLDVRPKLTVEGTWMRAQRWLNSWL